MNAFISLVVMLLLVGCGKEQSTSIPKQVTTTRNSNSAQVLRKDSESCQSEKTYLHDDKVIHSVVYGEESEILQTPLGERHYLRASPKMVFVCEDESHVSQTSIEGAALQITKVIRETHDYFRSVIPDVSVTPVKINISPLISRSSLIRNADGTYTKVSSYLTDNAFYSPSDSMIAFLPQSTDQFNSGYARKLWQVPMVPSHEYGHHLFQMLAGTARTRTSCFGNHQEKPVEKNIRLVSVNDVMTAYNEGFADLVAYYTLSPQERRISDIRCLNVSRDVESKVFYDGNPKSFSPRVISLFFSSFPAPSTSCEVTNYQDVHFLGAILAHTYNEFMEELRTSSEERLATLAEWVRLLPSAIKRNSGARPQDFFRTTYAELLRLSVLRSGHVFDDRICAKVKLLFPDLQLSECRN